MENQSIKKPANKAGFSTFQSIVSAYFRLAQNRSIRSSAFSRTSVEVA